MPTVEQFDSVSGDSVAFLEQTINIGSYANSLLIVGSCFNNDNLETSSVLWKGSQINQLGSIVSVDDARVEIWYLVNPSTGSGALRVNYSATLIQGCVLGWAVVSGVHQSTPLGAMASAQAQSGGGTSISINVVSVANDLVFACLSAEDVAGITEGGGQSVLWDVIIASTTGSGGSTKVAVGTSTTMSYTLATDEHRCMAGVAIKPAAAGIIGALLGGKLIDKGILQGRLIR